MNSYATAQNRRLNFLCLTSSSIHIYIQSCIATTFFFFHQLKFSLKGWKPIEHITRGQKDGSKKQITNSAQGPPTIPNDPEGTPPPRGQTLRLRRRPPSKRHRVKPTVDSPEGTGNYSLNTITTANAFHSGESKLGERQSRVRDLIRHRSTPSPS